MKKAIMMDQKDNVATLLAETQAEEMISIVSPANDEIKEIVLKDEIPIGHKLAVNNIQKDSIIRKFGETIGRATRRIVGGEHVHIHNVVSTIRVNKD